VTENDDTISWCTHVSAHNIKDWHFVCFSSCFIGYWQRHWHCPSQASYAVCMRFLHQWLWVNTPSLDRLRAPTSATMSKTDSFFWRVETSTLNCISFQLLLEMFVCQDVRFKDERFQSNSRLRRNYKACSLFDIIQSLWTHNERPFQQSTVKLIWDKAECPA